MRRLSEWSLVNLRSESDEEERQRVMNQSLTNAGKKLLNNPGNPVVMTAAGGEEAYREWVTARKAMERAGKLEPPKKEYRHAYATDVAVRARETTREEWRKDITRGDLPGIDLPKSIRVVEPPKPRMIDPETKKSIESLVEKFDAHTPVHVDNQPIGLMSTDRTILIMAPESEVKQHSTETGWLSPYTGQRISEAKARSLGVEKPETWENHPSNIPSENYAAAMAWETRNVEATIPKQEFLKFLREAKKANEGQTPGPLHLNRQAIFFYDIAGPDKVYDTYERNWAQYELTRVRGGTEGLETCGYAYDKLYQIVRRLPGKHLRLGWSKDHVLRLETEKSLSVVLAPFIED